MVSISKERGIFLLAWIGSLEWAKLSLLELCQLFTIANPISSIMLDIVGISHV